MFRPLLIATIILICPAAAYSTGIIGIGGSTSQVVEQLNRVPEVRVDNQVYDRIMEGFNTQERVHANFRGENMELVNIKVNGRDNVVETQLRLKIIKKDQ